MMLQGRKDISLARKIDFPQFFFKLAIKRPEFSQIKSLPITCKN